MKTRRYVPTKTLMLALAVALSTWACAQGGTSKASAKAQRMSNSKKAVTKSPQSSAAAFNLQQAITRGRNGQANGFVGKAFRIDAIVLRVEPNRIFLSPKGQLDDALYPGSTETAAYSRFVINLTSAKPWQDLDPQEEIRIEATVASVEVQEGNFQETRHGFDRWSGTTTYVETVTRKFQVWQFKNAKLIAKTKSSEDIAEAQRAATEQANLSQLVSAAGNLDSRKVMQLLAPVKKTGLIQSIGAKAAIAAILSGANYADGIQGRINALDNEANRLRRELSQQRDPVYSGSGGGDLHQQGAEMERRIKEYERAANERYAKSQRITSLVQDASRLASEAQAGFAAGRVITGLCLEAGGGLVSDKSQLPSVSSRFQAAWSRHPRLVSTLDLALDLKDWSLLESIVRLTPSGREYVSAFGRKFSDNIIQIIGTDESRDTGSESRRLRAILKTAQSKGL